MSLVKIDSKRAFDKFVNIYNNKTNVMTPRSLKYYKVNNKFYVELSYGEFMKDKIYGVTVLPITLKSRDDLTEEQHNLSKMFYSKDDAEQYIYNELVLL